MAFVTTAQGQEPAVQAFPLMTTADGKHSNMTPLGDHLPLRVFSIYPIHRTRKLKDQWGLEDTAQPPMLIPSQAPGKPQ